MKDLFRCPAQEIQPTAISIGSNGGWWPPLEYSSYIFSEALLAYRDHSRAGPHGEWARIKKKQSVFFAIDGNPRRHFFAIYDFPIDTTMLGFRDHGDQDILDYNRHGFHANVLFTDWHVADVPLTESGLVTVGVSKGVFGEQ